MDPQETGARYEAIASWWLEQMKDSTYGVAALDRALTYVRPQGHALDIGCGCEGRFIGRLLDHGFQCTGLDISPAMIDLVRPRYPAAEFAVGDVCTWPLSRRYDLITAWDSTFHLPLAQQEPVLLKLCEGLSPGGVLLFTCGGGEEPARAQGEFGGQRFDYSSLGVPGFVRLLWRCGCAVQHLEYDQYPENHVYVVAKKRSGG